MNAVDRFLELACVDYEKWRLENIEKAERMLADDPSIASANIWAAAAAGNVDGVRDGDVNAEGGPHGWVPLLYACYSRLDRPTLEVARVLLERGADPNAGYLWHGNVPPFTALTAAFGHGEDDTNQPPHRESEALARLLLDAGADPNDWQTLYNRHFRRDDTHLKVLFEYGLGTDKNGPWYRRLGDQMLSPAKQLVEELWSAARKNYFDRVKLLVEHGTDVNGKSFRDGRTPYEGAMLFGNREVAEYLAAQGATRTELPLRERFTAACIAADRSEVEAILREHPSLPQELGAHGRLQVVQRAVEAHRPEGVRLLAELGFEITGVMKHDGVGINLAATPLHNASGNLAMVKLLISLGADPNVRDAEYHATPLGWAAHGHHWDVVAYLLPLTTSDPELVEELRRRGH